MTVKAYPGKGARHLVIKALFTAHSCVVDTGQRLIVSLNVYVKISHLGPSIAAYSRALLAQGKVTVKAYPGKGARHLVIKVVDQGCGIPRDKLLTIFEAFKQV